MNDYRGGEMSTEVVVEQNLWTADRSEIVLQAWFHGKTVTFVCTNPSSRPVLTFFFLLVFFSFSVNLKLPIMPFSYFVIQFSIKAFVKKIMI